MNKTELIEHIANNADISKAAAARALESTIDAVKKTLKKGGTVSLFYHYFASKEAFGMELIERYASYFAYKLDSHFGNQTLAPLARLEAFVADAVSGMERYDFKRGCLIGNLGQEMNGLPESFRNRLVEVFKDWETRTAACLDAAKAQGQVAPAADTAELACVFWIGWEGAVLRAKLERSARPLQAFAQFFAAGLPRA
nr:TetR family transcriptional regulator C-terminal domain-containing protein [Comamonas jiangduensis]